MSTHSCPLCGHKHDLESPHIWFDKDTDDFTMADGSNDFDPDDFDGKPTITRLHPKQEEAPVKDSPEAPKASIERLIPRRPTNREAYNAKMREYMRKRRQRKKEEENPTGGGAPPITP